MTTKTLVEVSSRQTITYTVTPALADKVAEILKAQRPNSRPKMTVNAAIKIAARSLTRDELVPMGVSIKETGPRGKEDKA